MHLLGIDVGEQEIRVARAERFLGVLRLTDLARIPAADPDARRSVLARLARGRRHSVLTTLPAMLVTHRILTLPFRDHRRLARTVPLELAGHVAPDVTGAAIGFVALHTTRAGSTVIAAAASRHDLEALTAPFDAAGARPSHVDLAPLPVWNLLPASVGDAALLLADGPRSTVSVRRDGRVAGLRALGAPATDAEGLVRELRWSLGALGPVPPTLVITGADATPPLTRALAEATAARVVPLARVASPGSGRADLDACAVAAGLVAGRGSARSVGLRLAGAPESGSLRRVAALAAIAATMGAIDVSLARHRLIERDAALAAAVRAEVAAVLPGAPLVAPRLELEAAASARSEVDPLVAGGVLAVLRELSTRVPRTVALDLDELTVDGSGVHLHGRARSFDAIDVVRRALTASPTLRDVRTDEMRTTVDGRHVEFRLHAVRGAPR